MQNFDFNSILNQYKKIRLVTIVLWLDKLCFEAADLRQFNISGTMHPATF